MCGGMFYNQKSPIKIYKLKLNITLIVGWGKLKDHYLDINNTVERER